MTPPTTAVHRLLASTTLAATVDLRDVACDDRRHGAVARRGPGQRVRRAEPGPAGPLVLEAHQRAGGTDLEVWGPVATPAESAGSALDLAAAWVGGHDDAGALDALAAGDTRVARLLAARGPLRLSRLPRVGEAVGRGVLGQLVQGVEARRSAAQLVAALAEPTAGGLAAWPTPEALRHAPEATLRRCGISGRGVRALRAAAAEDVRLRTARAEGWDALDARLRALPGIGAWTSAEARLALGDADAVSVGDANLPGLVGHVLAGDRDCDDAGMLALLAPFAGQRGRVVRLIETSVARGIVRPPTRRAPRAALSAHRYW
ncbi:MAG: hypothetical protein R6T85_04805 [Egibacteraceae bacterium]